MYTGYRNVLEQCRVFSLSRLIYIVESWEKLGHQWINQLHDIKIKT